MVSLHFDIRDLFRLIRLGWSGKKIWAGLGGLFVAYVLYSVLVTVGYVVSGMSGGEVWATYGLFPGASPAKVGGFAAVLHLLAMILSGIVIARLFCVADRHQVVAGVRFASFSSAYLVLTRPLRARSGPGHLP